MFQGFKVRFAVSFAVLVVLACALPAAADDEEAAKFTAEDVVALGKKLEASFCRVEVTLKYDNGQAPHGLTTSEYSSLDETIADHRPVRLAGFFLAPDQVLIRDPELEHRFIEKIEVVQGDARVGASLCAYAHAYNASYLALDAPIESAVPIVFDASKKGPYLAAWYGENDAEWVVTIASTLQRVTLKPDGAVGSTWSESIIVTKDGTAVGLSTRGELRVDGAWKGSPLDWKRYDMGAMEGLEQGTEAISERGLLSVKLLFRSPKASDSGGNPWESMMGEDEGDTETERDAIGVLVDDTQVLVLERLDPETTARLETIQVRSPDREPLIARFVASLEDYGALVAQMDEPLPGAVVTSARPIRSYLYEMLLGAHIELHGEQRDVHIGHFRTGAVSRSWRDQIMPSFDGPAAGYYVFDTAGTLVAFPIERRRPGAQDRWDREGAVTMPAAYLLPALSDVANHSDPNNVPVSEDEEGRIAWFGVELQPLDRELARVNEVSHLTDDGESGALVSFVYPDSPAAKGGIEPGAILLRVHVPDRPQPIPVGGGDGGYDILSQIRGMGIPEEMWGSMPGFQPWGTANNWINQTLTEIGFGKPFSLEYHANGEVVTKAFVVEKGPPHFEAAPQHKSETLGITVKDLTYEARRYYQLEPEAPGVIVAKVESGEPAGVAGIKAFEIVTEVGGQPMMNVADFESAITVGGELQLKVKNRLRDRVVKLKPANGDDGD